GVEEATLHGLANFVKADGGDKLVAPLVVGPRNQPIVDFLNRNGFRSSDESTYALNVAAGLSLPKHIEWREPSAATASVTRHAGNAAA
ncbi:MAG: hypothetical protein AABP62_03515, partial [Planctomycetota bacterium]